MSVRRLTGPFVSLLGEPFNMYKINRLRFRSSIFCKAGLTKTWLVAFDYKKHVIETSEFYFKFQSREDAMKFHGELSDHIENLFSSGESE